MKISELIKKELEKSNGKLSYDFTQSILNSPDTKVIHSPLMSNTRTCVIVLPTGHNLVGYAQVLNVKNDEYLIGQEVAYENAAEKIWEVLGAIAKAISHESGN